MSVSSTRMEVPWQGVTANGAAENSAPTAASRGVDLHAVSRPARTFTGDFYFVHEDRRGIWFVLGDVAGKGLPAAVTMAMIQEELDHRVAAWVEARSDPAEIMHHLHRFLEPILPDNRFATAVVGHLRRDGRLVIANAGQCPPLIARSNGTVESFSSTGPVVGLLPNPQWSSRATVLKPGDTLLLYSDGLIETTSHAGEEFGLASVRSALTSAAFTESSAREITNKILGAFDHHVRGYRGDDLTLMVMSR